MKHNIVKVADVRLLSSPRYKKNKLFFLGGRIILAATVYIYLFIHFYFCLVQKLAKDIINMKN